MLISDICLEMKGRVKKKCVMVTAAVLSGSRLMKFKWGSSDSVQSPPNSVRQPTQQKWAKTKPKTAILSVFRQLIFSCSYFWLNSNLQRKNRPPKLFLLFIFSHAWLVYFVRHLSTHTYSYAPSSLLAVHSPALRKQVGCRGRDILVLQMKTLQAASKEILYDVSTTDLQRHEKVFSLYVFLF